MKVLLKWGISIALAAISCIFLAGLVVTVLFHEDGYLVDIPITEPLFSISLFSALIIGSVSFNPLFLHIVGKKIKKIYAFAIGISLFLIAVITFFSTPTGLYCTSISTADTNSGLSKFLFDQALRAGHPSAIYDNALKIYDIGERAAILKVAAEKGELRAAFDLTAYYLSEFYFGEFPGKVSKNSDSAKYQANKYYCIYSKPAHYYEYFPQEAVIYINKEADKLNFICPMPLKSHHSDASMLSQSREGLSVSEDITRIQVDAQSEYNKSIQVSIYQKHESCMVYLDEWILIKENTSKNECAKLIFQDKCVENGESIYGRWGGHTLRLVGGGVVEISDDDKSFDVFSKEINSCRESRP